MSLKLWLYIAIGVAVIASAGGLYWHIYSSGEESVRIEQEKQLNKLKDKTDAVQDRALTTTTPHDELRKYSRPD